MPNSDIPYEPHEEARPSLDSPWGDDVARPVTWPRQSVARYQPRSRLNQALDVAKKILSTPQDPVARAETPQREHLPEAERLHSFEELELFPNGLVRTAAPRSEWTGSGTGSDTASTPWQAATPESRPSPAASGAPSSTDRGAWGQSVQGGGTGWDPVPIPRPGRETTPFREPEPAVAAPPQVVDTLQESRTEPFHLVVDLRPGRPSLPGPAPASPQVDYGLGRRWGVDWKTSAQGWVGAETGRPVWRPVVTTTNELANWDVETYLGVVTAEVAVEAQGGDFQQLGATLAHGREVGVSGLVEEAVERGAHAVIGVAMHYTPMGQRLLITISGTAVTLREKG